MTRKLYVEITDPFAESDDIPAWSGEISEIGNIETGRDALESGVYAALDENGGLRLVEFSDNNSVWLIDDPWMYYGMTR